MKIIIIIKVNNKDNNKYNNKNSRIYNNNKIKS